MSSDLSWNILSTVIICNWDGIIKDYSVSFRAYKLYRFIVPIVMVFGASSTLQLFRLLPLKIFIERGCILLICPLEIRFAFVWSNGFFYKNQSYIFKFLIWLENFISFGPGQSHPDRVVDFTPGKGLNSSENERFQTHFQGWRPILIKWIVHDLWIRLLIYNQMD